VALGVIAALSCGREVTAPEGRFVARGFSFAPQFRAHNVASSVIGDLVPFDRVRVVLRNAAGDIVVDRLVDFPVGADSVPLNLNVPLSSASGEVMALSLAYINASGDTVFRGGPVSVNVVPTRAGSPPPPAPTIDVDYVGTGANAASVRITPRADTVLSGSPFAFTAQALGADSLPIANTPIGWRSLTPSLASITTATAGTGTTLAGRGEARIEAFLLSGQTDTVSVVVLPRAATIEIVSGNNQVGLPGQTLSAPVVVRVRATDNLPMAGVSVNFVAGGDGDVGASPVITDANGLASTSWTLGTTSGVQALTASFAGIAGAPAVFAASTPTVQLLHHFPFTSGLADVAGSASGSLLSGASVSGGILTLDGEGAYAQFTSALVPSGSWTISMFVRNRTPLDAQAVYLGQGSAGAPALSVGHAASGSFTYLDTQATGVLGPATDGLFRHIVIVADSLNDFITVYRNGTPWITGNAYTSIPAGGTMTRLGRGVAGSEEYFDGDIDELRIYSGALEPSEITALYTAGATAPARLVFTSQPAQVGLGVPIAPSVCVAVEDALGRPMPTFSGSVTMTLGNNPGDATLGGTTTVAASGGAACFANLTVSAVGSGYTLVPAASNAVGEESAPFDVIDQGLAALVVTTAVGTQAAGETLAPELVVEARTGGGLLVTDFDGPVTIAIANGPGGAVLDGTTTVLAENGIAVFADLKLTTAGAGYVLEATTPGAAAGATNPFTVTAGAATRVGITQAPTSGMTGVALSPALVASAYDAYGNFANSYAGTLSVALVTSPSGAELEGTTNVAAVAGVATFSNLLLDLPGAYTLEIGAEGLGSDTTGTITVAAAGATKLLFVQEPIGGTVNAALAPPVIVHALTDDDAIAAGFDGPVTVALGANPGGATLGGTLTVNAVNGVATFANLSINVAANGYTLLATSPDLLPSTTSTFDVVLVGVRNAWVNPDGGLWSVPANWSEGRIPNATDTVAIDLAGTYTVTLDQHFSGTLVQLGGASGTQTLQATSRTLSTGLGLRIGANGVYRQQGGTVGGSGQVQVRGRYTTVTNAAMSAPLYVDTTGTLRVEASSLGASTTLTVSTGFVNDGLIELEALNASYTTTLGVTTGTLVNSATGTIRSLLGATGARVVAAELDNSGTVDVSAHALTLNKAGAQHVNRAPISLSVANLTVTQSGTAPRFTNLSTITIGAGRTLSVSSGTLDVSNGLIDGQDGSLLLSGTAIDADAANLRTRINFGSVVSPLLSPMTVLPGDSLRLLGGIVGGAELAVEGHLVVLGPVTFNNALAVPEGGLVELRATNVFGGFTSAVTNGFTNEGTIELVSQGAGYAVTLAVTNGVLENAPSGTIRSRVGSAGSRTLAAVLDNAGTLEILQPLTLAKASAQHVNRSAFALDSANLTVTQTGTAPSFTNLGQISLAPGRAMTVTGGLLDLSQGLLDGPAGTLATSNLTLAMTPATVHTVHQLGTRTTLAAPFTVPDGDSLRIRSGTLDGPGLAVEGQLILDGPTTFELPLSVAPTGHLLLRASNLIGSFTATVQDGFVNEGLVEFTTLNAGYSVTLAVTNGTLENDATGTIRSSVGAGGSRTLAAQLDNSGMLDLLQPLTLNRASSAHVNRAPVTLDANLTVTQSGTTPSFTNLSTITLPSGRTLSVTGGALDLSGGTLLGDTATLSLNNVLLTMTPASARTRFHFNTLTTLSGAYTVPAGDSLRIIGGTLGGPGLTVAGRVTTLATATLAVPVTTEPTGVLEARSTNFAGSHTFTVTNGFTNVGTVELASFNAGYTTTFAVTNGTLVNAAGGVIRSVAGAGGARTLAAQLENDGDVELETTLQLLKPNAAHINRGNIPLTTANFTVTQSGAPATFTNEGSITIAAGRTMQVSGGALTLSDGTLVGDDGSLVLSNVLLAMTPSSARTRFNFGTGSAFASPYTIPAGDSLRVIGGTVGGPGLTVGGRFVALATATIAAPITTTTTGTIEARSTNLAGGLDLIISNGFENVGTIELVSLNAGYSTRVLVSNGTLVNAPSGTIRSLVGAGGIRALGAELDNSGTLDIQQPLEIGRAGAAHVHRSTLNLGAADLTVTQTGTTPSFTNLGDITLANGRTLTVNGGALDLSGGTLVGDTATLTMTNVALTMTPASARTRFRFNSTAFTAPYTIPAGDSMRVLSGTVGGPGLTVAGRFVSLGATTISAPVTTAPTGTIEARSTNIAGGHTLTVLNGFENVGTIEINALNAGYATSFAVTNGTLVNASGGTIRSVVGAGGTRTLAAELDNNGSLDLMHPLTINKAGAAHVNRSAFTLSAANLSVSQSGTTPSFTNLGSITMDPGRTFAVTGGALNLADGLLTGEQATLAISSVSLSMAPAAVRTRIQFTNSAFAGPYAVPAGDSLIILGGTIGGPGLTLDGRLVTLAATTISAPLAISSTGELVVRSTNFAGGHTTTVSNGFTNAGLIDLATENAGYTSSFAVTNGTLVNAPGASIRALPGAGGSRGLFAELDNQGTLLVNSTLALNRAGSVHVNSGLIELDAANLTVTQSGTSPSFTNLGNITMAPGRTLTVTGGALTLDGGTIDGDAATLSTNNVLLSLTPASARTRFNFGTSTTLASAYTVPAADSMRLVGGTLAGPSLTVAGRVVALTSSTLGLPVITESTGILEARGNPIAGGVTFTVTNGFTNNGLVDIISEGAGYANVFAVTNGVLVNGLTGTIRSSVGSGGTRTLRAALDHSGTLEVLHPLVLDRANSAHVIRAPITLTPANLTFTQSGAGASFTNLDDITIGSGRTLAVNGGAVDLTGGTVSGETGTLQLGSGTATALTMTSPAQARSRLHFGGTGTQLVTTLTIPDGDSLIVGGGTLSGTESLAVGGVLHVRGNSTISAPIAVASTGTVRVVANGTAGGVTLTTPSGWTNGGTIELTATDGNSWTSALAVTNGTLVNASGATIRSAAGTGGARTLTAQLQNAGALDVEFPMTMNRASSVHLNTGAITVAPTASLSVTQSGTTPSFTNEGAITLNGTGNRLTVSGGAFTNVTGALTGTGTLGFSGTVSANLAVPAVDVPLSLGTGTTLASALTVPVGDTLRLVGGTLAGPGVALNGALVVTGTSTVTAPLTTSATALVDIRTTTLTTPQSWTNNGTLRLTAVNTSANPTLTMTGQTLTNTSAALIDMPTGAGPTRYINAATIENEGTMTVNAGFINNGIVNQRGTMSILSGTTTIPTLNLFAGHATTVNGTLSVPTACSNAGTSITGTGTWPASCNP
jgi:hypothetical protein